MNYISHPISEGYDRRHSIIQSDHSDDERYDSTSKSRDFSESESSDFSEVESCFSPITQQEFSKMLFVGDKTNLIFEENLINITDIAFNRILNTLVDTRSIINKTIFNAYVPDYFEIYNDEDEQIITSIFTKIIGFGGSSYVLADDSDSLVLKIVNNTSFNKSLLHEYQLLRHINPCGLIAEFQSPPRCILKIKDIYGYIEDCRISDYKSDIINNDFETNIEGRIKECGKILRMLQLLEEKNMVHGDIKASNILVSQDKEGNKILCLADWAGALSEKEISEGCIPHRTKSNIHNRDIEYLNEHKQYLGTNNKIATLRIKWILKKIDIFNCGLVMYQALTDYQRPYPRSQLQDEYIIGNPINNLPTYIPSQLKTLVMDMINPNSLSRPTVEEVIEQFHECTFF